MMRNGAALALAAASFGIGCDAKTPAPQDPTSQPTAPAPTAASTATAAPPAAIRSARPSDPDPDPITHPCVVAIAQFEQKLKNAAGTCQSAADCDCYPGGLGRKSGCGGVTDKATAKTLHDLAAEFRKDGCTVTQNCAARACQPRCEAGKCVE